jgi:purine-binding chemotaxis protein CheW
VELSRPLEKPDEEDRSPIAVVRIGEEVLGVPLTFVREFVRPGAITPVPNCPAQVVGVMSVRGEIVSVVDIRPALALPADENVAPYAALLDCGGTRFAILTNEILEVTSVSDTSSPESVNATGRFFMGLFFGGTEQRRAAG